VKRIAFTEQARADVRRLDIPTAMRIFAGLQRFAETGVGDVKKLEGQQATQCRSCIWYAKLTSGTRYTTGCRGQACH
jgi:hypothetical protein